MRRFPRFGMQLFMRCWMVAAVAAVAGCATQDGKPGAARYSREQAESEFDKGDKPPMPKTLYAMAKVLASQGRDAECENLLRRIIQSQPRFLPAYCELAQLQVRNQRVSDAIQTVSVGLGVAPDDPVLLNNLGMCRVLRNDYIEAVAPFTRAASVRPQNPRYRANLAVSLGMLGRYEESLALYQQVVPAAEAHYNVAVLCDARMDRQSAIREYGRANDLGLAEAGRQEEKPIPVD